MTEEEIELIAEELARIGGSWYPERTRPTLRAVGNRHRDVARLLLAALDRMKAAKQESEALKTAVSEGSGQSRTVSFLQEGQLHAGATVVYRPPGEKRAITCKVEEVDHGRAYLVPIHREIGWVSTHTLLPLKTRLAG
jgi:hypothetical protein